MTAPPASVAGSLFVTAPRNLDDLLQQELADLGARQVRRHPGGVSVADADLALAYRICLHSRIANRVLWHLIDLDAQDGDAIYAGARQVPWHLHLDASKTFAVSATVRSAPEHDAGAHQAGGLDSLHYATLRVKDAVVDHLRERGGERPNVDTRSPDLRLHLHLTGAVAALSLDLAGNSLHQRGYRLAGHPAPLKENLAAALLLRAGWPEIAGRGGALMDPMCGGATLLIEGAWMAMGIAPGLLRARHGFEGWGRHDATLWASLLADARRTAEAGRAAWQGQPLVGHDIDGRAVQQAVQQVARAGLSDLIAISQRDLAELTPPAEATFGLLITNAPYGERMGDAATLELLYSRLGQRLKAAFAGWRAAVLSGDAELVGAVGLRASRRNAFHNGPLACTLVRYEIDQSAAPAPPMPEIESFINRLRKNSKRLARWAARRELHCYRLYDADIPEIAVAIDRYHDMLHVQEYAPPTHVDARRARARLSAVLDCLPGVMGIPRDKVFLKVRRKQKGSSQYEKVADQGRLVEVQEGGHRFLVNLSDYIDTGLFLDHRLTRALIGRLAGGTRFLNLFAYTGSATVYAAKGGALSSLSVDLSNTYGEWCEKNLRLNGIDTRKHQVVRADVTQFVLDERGRFDLIFLDPPTFSVSKAMDEAFDLQRDHVGLLRATARLLAPGGTLIFSNNFRRFKMDHAALSDLVLEEITAETIDEDFRRRPRMHNCWRITRG